MNDNNAAKGVVINGIRTGESLSIRRLSGVRSNGFEVSARVGSASATHDYVQFFTPTAFLAQLKEFEESRSGEAMLVGNPDFEIIFKPHGSRGDAFLRFKLADPQIFLTDSMYGEMLFNAGFVIPGERLGSIVTELESLFT